LFFIESGLLGSVGGAVGALFGYLAATGLAFAGRFALGSDLIAAHVTPQLIIASILFSFVVGSFFGTFPAVQASKLNPVDALRSTK
jgi:putative ABC transport system permease protein